MISMTAALLLSGLAAAQAFSPADFDRGAPAPGAILRELAASAAAMPGVPGQAVPELPPGTKKEYLKPFRAAFLNAIGRLRAPQCGAFYGEGAQGRLEGASYRFMGLGKPHLNAQGLVTVVGASTFADGPPPAMVFINAEGPFLYQSMLVAGKSGFQTVDMGTGLRGADFGALILLHELGHVVGKFGPDAADSALNRSYTDLVLKNCF